MNKVIIAIDPGVTTGLAVMHLSDDDFKLLEVQQLVDPDDVWVRLRAIIENYCDQYDDVDILCESFEIRPDVISPDETPKYIIKDLDRYVAPDYPIMYQTASQAKVGVPPGRNGMRDRLHAFGLHQKALRHANDAIRHILAYSIDKLRHKPIIIRGWGLPGKK